MLVIKSLTEASQDSHRLLWASRIVQSLVSGHSGVNIPLEAEQIVNLVHGAQPLVPL